jgi:thiamine-phosphate pyrophosphorylase
LKLCYITDRRSLPGGKLARTLREAVAAGIDMVQIREKDLETRILLNLVKDVVSFSQDTRTRILVNDRLDVARAAAAAGVHLGGQSLPVTRVRAIVPPGFVVGVSCHSVQDVSQAELAGADYALLGPVFETPSKAAYGPPLGLNVLREAASRAAIPIYALGGITVDRASQCLEAGASGIAGIRLFQESLSDRVAELRAKAGANGRLQESNELTTELP